MKLGDLLRAHAQLVAYVGTSIVFLTFLVKEGLHESWSKDAEVLDAAQYMYGLSTVNTETDLKLSNILSELVSLRQSGQRESKQRDKRVAIETVIPDEMFTRIEAASSHLEGSIANARILIERLPELESMERESDRFEQALKDADDEMEFLSERTAEEALSQLKRGEHKPWVYTPKKPPNHYIRMLPHPDPTPIQVYLESDFDTANTLATDIREFNQGILDEAKTLRSRDERRARWAWWIAAALYTLGWGLGLAGKVYGLPTGGESS
jgi:hypothetical protein